MYTSKALTEQNVDHYIVIEKQDVKAYQKAIKDNDLLTQILELPPAFKNNYELCDNFGLTKSTGAGPARNFVWEHSSNNGFSHHWVMDDNIRDFRRFNKNLKVKTTSPAFWQAMEDFTLRYKNVAMSGPNYSMFVPQNQKNRPFTLNTRIYSCNLIRNDVTFKWRGRYNEDTILSLDMLKAGWCTILFNALLQTKLVTQLLTGGNTTELYQADDPAKKGEKYSQTGTVAKSQMLVNEHPDVSKVVKRFGRVHHHVDYTSFKKQKLIKKDNVTIKKGINNYGMELVNVK
jgi:hypothetical protein